MTRLPIYTINKKNGNIAEALVQFHLSKFCLVHKIDGSNDVGNDFICEIVRDQSPANLLFYVQVKFTSNGNKPTIKAETKEYWKGSPIPVFVFWVKEVPPAGLRGIVNDSTNNLLYKRFTPIVHGKIDVKKENYKTYEQGQFIDDLLVDYARTQYIKGFTPVVNVRDYVGMDDKLFWGFPRYMLFTDDVVLEYQDQIKSKSWTTFFSLAKILYKEDNREDLELALDFIKKAKNFYHKYVTGDDYSETFAGDMLSCQNEIENKLTRIRNNS